MTIKGEEKAGRYPLAMRILHWVRALLIFGLIFVGWLMMNILPETHPLQAVLFPNHKQFGILTFILGLVALLLRSRSRVPELPGCRRRGGSGI